eukprot:15441704-Alexandrium_andersonii.AAC.1
MEERFERKVEGLLGGGAEDLREARLLSRVTGWMPEGLLYEAGSRHAEQLIDDLPAPTQERRRRPSRAAAGGQQTTP